MGLLTSKLFTVPPNDKLERCALRRAGIDEQSSGPHCERHLFSIRSR